MNRSFLLLVALLLASMSVRSWGQATYTSDLAAFFSYADEHYPFFDLKNMRPDWETAKADLLARAESCESDEAFVAVIRDAVMALRDSHASIVESRVAAPPWPVEYYPGIGFLEGTDGQVLVAWPGPYGDRIPAGTVITHIDSEPAAAFLQTKGEAAWRKGGHSSPQRATLVEWRIPLRGERGTKHELTGVIDDQPKVVEVICDQEARGWPHTYNMPERLQRSGRSFHYTRLPSGVGYMYLRRVDESVAPGIDEALDYVMYAKGWIVDLRGNGGGGYDQALLDALGRIPRPVAVIIDAGTVSAGETLARDIRRIANARLFGQQSAGASSSKHTWSFPSGIATVRFSTRSRWRNDGAPIEYNGIAPDERVCAAPDDVRAGQNTPILAAEEWCVKQSQPAKRPATP